MKKILLCWRHKRLPWVVLKGLNILVWIYNLLLFEMPYERRVELEKKRWRKRKGKRHFVFSLWYYSHWHQKKLYKCTKRSQEVFYFTLLIQDSTPFTCSLRLQVKRSQEWIFWWWTKLASWKLFLLSNLKHHVKIQRLFLVEPTGDRENLSSL